MYYPTAPPESRSGGKSGKKASIEVWEADYKWRATIRYRGKIVHTEVCEGALHNNGQVARVQAEAWVTAFLGVETEQYHP